MFVIAKKFGLYLSFLSLQLSLFMLIKNLLFNSANSYFLISLIFMISIILLIVCSHKKSSYKSSRR